MCADEKQRGAIPENTAVNPAKYGEPNFCLTAASIQSIVRIDERKKNGKSKDLPFFYIGRPRFELGTNCLKGNCSTVELSARCKLKM